MCQCVNIKWRISKQDNGVNQFNERLLAGQSTGLSGITQEIKKSYKTLRIQCSKFPGLN